MALLMMNSARQADAVVRHQRERERLVGVADVHHDLGARAARPCDRSMRSTSNGSAAVVDEPGVSLGARHGDDLAGRRAPSCRSRCRQSPGRPSSRLTMAAWHVRPPRLVTMAAAFFMIGSQSGSVLSVTSTSPGLEQREIGGVRDDADRRRSRSCRPRCGRSPARGRAPQSVLLERAGPPRARARSPAAPAR